jgi:hypothetical protein
VNLPDNLLTSYTPIEQVNLPRIRSRKDSVKKTLLIKLNGTVVHVLFFFIWAGLESGLCVFLTGLYGGGK